MEKNEQPVDGATTDELQDAPTGEAQLSPEEKLAQLEEENKRLAEQNAQLQSKDHNFAAMRQKIADLEAKSTEPAPAAAPTETVQIPDTVSKTLTERGITDEKTRKLAVHFLDKLTNGTDDPLIREAYLNNAIMMAEQTVNPQGGMAASGAYQPTNAGDRPDPQSETNTEAYMRQRVFKMDKETAQRYNPDNQLANDHFKGIRNKEIPDINQMRDGRAGGVSGGSISQRQL